MFAAGRFTIRFFTVEHLLLDDLSFALATVALIPMSVCWQKILPDTYFLPGGGRGLAQPPSQGAMLEIWLHDRRYADAGQYLFFIVTWLVKLSYLLFYRTLFGVSNLFMKVWWAITIVVFLAFWVCIAGIMTLCGKPADSYNIRESSQT